MVVVGNLSPHPGWIAARAHQEKIGIFFFYIFCIFPVHGKNGLRWPQIGPGGLFPTNPDLADILGRTDLNFETFYFFHFLDPTFLDFQVPRSQKFWISRSPDLQIPRSPNSQISRFPDFQTPPPDELSDPNLTPLPTHPGNKYVARSPCCDKFESISSNVSPELLLHSRLLSVGYLI